MCLVVGLVVSVMMSNVCVRRVVMRRTFLGLMGNSWNSRSKSQPLSSHGG